MFEDVFNGDGAVLILQDSDQSLSTVVVSLSFLDALNQVHVKLETVSQEELGNGGGLRNDGAVELSLVEGLNDGLETLNDGDKVVDVLFLDQSNDGLGGVEEGVNISETGVGVVEGEGIDLVEDSDINVARVEEGVEYFSGVVRSSQDILDGERISLSLGNENLDFVSKFSSTSEASFEVDVQLGDGNFVLSEGRADQSD